VVAVSLKKEGRERRGLECRDASESACLIIRLLKETRDGGDKSIM